MAKKQAKRQKKSTPCDGVLLERRKEAITPEG